MRRLRSCAIIMALLLGACGGATDQDDDDIGATSGLDRDAPVRSLDEVELGMLCDWVSARLGGYGVSRDCGNGTTASTTANREECLQSTQTVTQSTTCEVTVGQYEDCANALNSNICDLAVEPLCTAIICM